MPKAPRVSLRPADRDDAPALHALISEHLVEGRLLPRTLEEIERHATRFVVAIRGRKLVACGELAPLGPAVAEVRSLVVEAGARRLGIGTRIVEMLSDRARRDGFDQLCAFTHTPSYFMPMGFSIVPHLWIPEKVFSDCAGCQKFRRCGQYAMVMPLDSVADSVEQQTPLVARHP